MNQRESHAVRRDLLRLGKEANEGLGGGTLDRKKG